MNPVARVSAPSWAMTRAAAGAVAGGTAVTYVCTSVSRRERRTTEALMDHCAWSGTGM